MIYGIGTDLVDLDRIRKIKSLSAFANKILGDQELEQYAELANGPKQFYLGKQFAGCLLYTSPSPRDATLSRMPSSA